MFQKSDSRRVIKTIVGGAAIAFSAYRFLNITSKSFLYIQYPGIAVLIIGMIHILKGILSKEESKITKLFDMGIGIFAIVAGIFIKAYMTDVASQGLILIFIIVQGIGSIGIGVIQSSKTKTIRIFRMVIGSVLLILSTVILEYTDLSLILTNGLLSTSILLIGIELIISSRNSKTAQIPKS